MDPSEDHNKDLRYLNGICLQHAEKNAYSYRGKPKEKIKKSVRKLYVDRRSGYDRRKSYSAHYFIISGVERRSWKERRYLWFMTE